MMPETLESVAIEVDHKELAEQLLAQAKEQGVELVGPNGLLNQLTKNVLETALDAEMAEHLGCDKHDPAGRGSGNSRNGSTNTAVYAARCCARIRPPAHGWNRSARTSSTASPKPNPTTGTARPRASRSVSPARTPNSPKWTRSAPAAPRRCNSASPASPTPPHTPAHQDNEISSDTTEHQLNHQDRFSSEKIALMRCGWQRWPNAACAARRWCT